MGRVRQIAEVRRELSRARLVTLTGPGGVGKTRLAEEACRGLVDGTATACGWSTWCRSRPASGCPTRSPRRWGSIPPRVPTRSRALVAPAGPAAAAAAAWTTASTWSTRAPDLVRRLLRECPRAAGTGDQPGAAARARRGDPAGSVAGRAGRGRSRWTAALGHEAVRLLVDRACDVRLRLPPRRSQRPAVVEICRRLDGVPLAIELAAARLAHLEPAEIAERLGDALAVLGRGDRVTRHATLRATLEWSHGLLTDDEQVLLRRLSVFAGGFNAACRRRCLREKPARAVDDAGLSGPAGGQVDGAGGADNAARSRYRLLETIRQFGRERLIAAGERAAIEAAHCAVLRPVGRRPRPRPSSCGAGAPAAARRGARQPAGSPRLGAADRSGPGPAARRQPVALLAGPGSLRGGIGVVGAGARGRVPAPRGSGHGRCWRLRSSTPGRVARPGSPSWAPPRSPPRNLSAHR